MLEEFLTKEFTEHDTTTSQKNLITNFISRFTRSRSRKVAPTEEQVRQNLTETTTTTPVLTFNLNDILKLYRHIVHLSNKINSVFDDKHIQTYQHKDHIELLKKFFRLLLKICQLERMQEAFNKSNDIKKIKNNILLLSRNKDFVSNGILLSVKEDPYFVSLKRYLYNEIVRVKSLPSFQLNIECVTNIIRLLNSVFKKLRDVYDTDHTYHYVSAPLSYDYPYHVPISLGVKAKNPITV